MSQEEAAAPDRGISTVKNFGEKVSIIWSVADLLRGLYKPPLQFVPSLAPTKAIPIRGLFKTLPTS